MSENDELEKIKQKLNELDKKYTDLVRWTGVYVDALILLLRDKGVASRKELRDYLEKSKKELSTLFMNDDFKKIMNQMKKKDEK